MDDAHRYACRTRRRRRARQTWSSHRQQLRTAASQLRLVEHGQGTVVLEGLQIAHVGRPEPQTLSVLCGSADRMPDQSAKSLHRPALAFLGSESLRPLPPRRIEATETCRCPETTDDDVLREDAVHRFSEHSRSFATAAADAILVDSK